MDDLVFDPTVATLDQADQLAEAVSSAAVDHADRGPGRGLSKDAMRGTGFPVPLERVSGWLRVS